VVEEVSVVAGRLRTPAPAYDVLALFPGIGEFGVSATRLHPCPGTPDPTGSHIGGMLAWPAAQAWPVCSAAHVVIQEEPLPEPLLTRLRELRQLEPARRWPGYRVLLAELADRAPGFTGIDRHSELATYQVTRPEPEPCPLVPLAQLRAADVPDLRPPEGADLLQVLWCPNDHDLDNGSLAPTATLRWRHSAGTGPLLDAAPPPTAVGHPAYLPAPCVLRPEQVLEFPWWQQLPVGIGYDVMVWDAEHGGIYHRQLAAAPGWKVGGWPRWPTTDPRTFYCERCADPMSQLLQVDSGEWGDPARWRPAGGAEPEPTGVIAGHTGLYRIFTCPSCPDSVRVDLQ
jgi:hypothetical protein